MAEQHLSAFVTQTFPQFKIVPVRFSLQSSSSVWVRAGRTWREHLITEPSRFSCTHGPYHSVWIMLAYRKVIKPVWSSGTERSNTILPDLHNERKRQKQTCVADSCVLTKLRLRPLGWVTQVVLGLVGVSWEGGYIHTAVHALKLESCWHRWCSLISRPFAEQRRTAQLDFNTVAWEGCIFDSTWQRARLCTVWVTKRPRRTVAPIPHHELWPQGKSSPKWRWIHTSVVHSNLLPPLIWAE